MAAVIFVIGTLGAYVAAAVVARNAALNARNAFASNSAQVVSATRLQLVREEDLAINAGAYVVGNPATTNGQFEAWTAAAQVMARYPEMESLGYIVYVPRDQLSTFHRRIDSDKSLEPAAPFKLQPPGVRPFYCLSATNFERPGTSIGVIPLGYDYCQSPLGAPAQASRDSGRAAYVPFQDAGHTYLAVGIPVYRGGTVPPTVVARQAASLGWLGFIMEPEVLLHNALQGHRGVGLTAVYHVGNTHFAVSAGPIQKGQRTLTTDLADGWTVTTHADLPSPGVFGNGTALFLLIAGIGSSGSLAAIVLVLATSRMRALRLVREKTAEIRHQALHDSLTGLPNRALVSDRAEQLLLRNRRRGTQAAALYLDLDGFKSVNDTFGHDIGDTLLRAVAQRLSLCVRNVDTIGRLGGDEFVVLLDGDSGSGGPELVAERILEALRTPFRLDGAPTPVVTTISVGVAIGDRPSAKDLIRDADVALYQAKADGKNCYAVYESTMDNAVHRQSQLEYDLRGALEQEQFRLYYQPMYDLEDLSILGFEALLRWEHPEFGLIGPDEFIPLLEASGEIVEVGHWVLVEACQQVAQWRQYSPSLSVSVNVSALQLDRDSIVTHVKDALTRSGLDPSGLTVEITESALMRNIDHATVRLHQLKAIGVQIAIDDFGTGYSSLAYVQTLPVDCLKIDRSFTKSIASSREADLVVHSMVELGKKLGLRTVAEGIETMTQVDHMRVEQVDEAQGFLFSKPVTADAIEHRFLSLAGDLQSDIPPA